jgi:DNA-binding NarL/FixJ family response regulator
MKTNINVMIVDDHDFYRNALKLALNRIENVTLTGEAKNGEEFLTHYQEANPDVVLMDIKMPGVNGIEASEKANKKWQNVKIIAITMFKEKAHVMNIASACIKGLLFKDSAEEELEKAIKQVNNGGFYFTQYLYQAV